MSPVAIAPSGIAPVDEDLVEQARPGHCIPSQDSNPAAQAPKHADAEALRIKRS